MRSFTSSLDPIFILSSLFWKELEKKTEKRKRDQSKKKLDKKGEKEKEKTVRKKREKNSDLSRLNLVVEFGLKSVLHTVQ